MNNLFFLLCLIFLFSPGAWAQSHKGISFQGVIKNPDGTYPNAVGTTATLKVLSPNNCVLWEEQHLGVNVTDGYVNLVVGKGTTGGYQPTGQTFQNVFNNTNTQTGLICLNFDGTVNTLATSYAPTSQDARKLRLEMSLPSGLLSADFNLRSMPFAVLAENAESAKKIGTKSETDLLAVNSGVGLTQAHLEEFIQSLTAAPGGSVLWDGGHFVAYDPTNGAGLSAGSVADASIASISWSKVSGVPSPLSEIGALSCIDGKIIKKVSGAWACADESGSGAEIDPTVEVYAKNAPGAGLTVNGSNQIVPDFGSTAGTVVQGDDVRLGDSRSPSGSASGDLSGSYPAPTVAAINGKSVTYASLVSGDILKYDGSGWVNSPLSSASLSDASDLLKAGNMPGTCSSDKTLTFSSPTGTWICSSIAIDAAAITGGTIADARLPASATYWQAATGGINYGAGNVGIGTASPGNKFVVSSGASGATAHGSATGVFEANSDNYVTLMTPDANESGVIFANATSNVAGVIVYNGANAANGLDFRVNGNSTKMVIALDGNVGIGTTAPAAKLEVSGQIVSKSFDNGASMSFDFSKGNVQYTTAGCGAMTLSNMVDGGSYVVAIMGTTAGTCSFSHAGLTFVSNYSGPTTDGTRSLVSFQRVGSFVFVNWNTGYQ